MSVNWSLLLCVLGCLSYSGVSQPAVNHTEIWGVNAQQGWIWGHAAELTKISQSNPWGFGLEYSRLNLTYKAWQRCNCYSKVGISFNYYNYDNPRILGNSYNLIVFAEPFLNFKQKMHYTLRAGLGITYLDKVYDKDHNPKNLFYSAPVSFILLINMGVNYKIAPQWTVHLTANYNHISNGGMRLPNKGINFPTLGVGVDHQINTVTMKAHESVQFRKGKVRGYGNFFATRLNVPSTIVFPEARSWLLGLSGGVLQQVASFTAFNAGLEIIRDHSLKEKGLRTQIDADFHIIALVAGHHLMFGRYEFNQHLAYYLYKPFPFTAKKFYQRYELMYRVNDLLLVGFSLKAHGHVAENFDLRVGMVF